MVLSDIPGAVIGEGCATESQAVSVRDHGSWEGWIEFFLRGVAEVAAESADTARRILLMRETHRDAITRRLGRAAANGYKVLESLYQRPIVSVNEVQGLTGTTYTAANTTVARLEEIGILQEMTGHARHRRFRYAPSIE